MAMAIDDRSIQRERAEFQLSNAEEIFYFGAFGEDLWAHLGDDIFIHLFLFLWCCGAW